ncbi:MAG: hypothetical protein GY754_41170 [bacterium]|nr:hypothetical protein [bacterium]
MGKYSPSIDKGKIIVIYVDVTASVSLVENERNIILDYIKKELNIDRNIGLTVRVKTGNPFDDDDIPF